MRPEACLAPLRPQSGLRWACGAAAPLQPAPSPSLDGRNPPQHPRVTTRRTGVGRPLCRRPTGLYSASPPATGPRQHVTAASDTLALDRVPPGRPSPCAGDSLPGGSLHPGRAAGRNGTGHSGRPALQCPRIRLVAPNSWPLAVTRRRDSLAPAYLCHQTRDPRTRLSGSLRSSPSRNTAELTSPGATVSLSPPGAAARSISPARGSSPDLRRLRTIAHSSAALPRARASCVGSGQGTQPSAPPSGRDEPTLGCSGETEEAATGLESR